MCPKSNEIFPGVKLPDHASDDTHLYLVLPPRVRVFDKLTVSQTFGKLPVFYATRMSITAFIVPPVPVLSQINQIHDFNPSS